MVKYYTPTKTAGEWPIRPQHTDPERSAMRLATAWQSALDFPPAVRVVLEGSRWFKNLEMLCGFPEHAVALSGQGAPSQTDLFVLARSRQGLVTITVEGKVDESFGRKVADWRESLVGSSRKRLSDICATLELRTPEVQQIRYQLLHRTASTVKEAERFYACKALMLVHSFDEEHANFADYEAFVHLFDPDLRVKPNRILFLGERSGIPLYVGWVADA